MDPIIAIMAIIGIGGGFAGLWWGWLEGEKEAHMRRVSFSLSGLTRSMNQFTFSTEELRRSFEAASKAVGLFGVRLASLKPMEPWRDRFHWYESAWYGHSPLRIGGLLDSSRRPQEGGAGGLPADVPADAVEVDPPCDVPGPGTAPPHTEE